MNPVAFAAIAAAATLLFVGLDLRDAGFRAGLWRDRVRARRNGLYLLSNSLTMLTLGASTALLTPHVPALFDWSSHEVLEVVGCFFVAELINWLAHWVKHKQSWLWTFHLQHHVETRYSTALTLHTHGLEVVVTGVWMMLTLALLGFSRLAIDVFTLSYFVANMYKHCSARMSLGPLDWLIVSPAYHRLHHAKHESGNYGSVLTVFDVVFGTARFVSMERAWALELGTPTDEPFGFRDEMLAFLRRPSPRDLRPPDRGAGRSIA